MLATKNPTAMAAVIIVQVHVVKQQAHVEVEDNDCTSEEVIEHLAVVLCRSKTRSIHNYKFVPVNGTKNAYFYAFFLVL